MIKSVGIFPNIVAKTVLIMKIYTRGDLAVLVINIFILQATFYRSIWMEYLLAELYIQRLHNSPFRPGLAGKPQFQKKTGTIVKIMLNCEQFDKCNKAM